MHITLEINDKNAKAFVDFIKTLDYVKISDGAETDFTIPEWHKNLIEERLESYKKDTGALKDFKQIIDDFKKSL